MADSAFQIQYRQEFIAQFEQGVSWLRTVCTTEAVIKGNQAMFLVAGSGGATAVTRGLNGNIPPRVDSLTRCPPLSSSSTTNRSEPSSTSSPAKATAAASCRCRRSR
jgi:hypothetical protein